MKLLVTIPTCHLSSNPSHQSVSEADRRLACRRTWLKDIPPAVDYRFFYGAGPHQKYADDEVRLDCPDGYSDLSLKMRRMCQWAIDHEYTHLLRVDTDAYVYLSRILKSGFEDKDYTGYCIPYPKHLEQHRYACGAGFILSRKAMDVIVRSNVTHPADDLWVGRVLYAAGIKCDRDTRYLTGFDEHYANVTFLPEKHPYLVIHSVTPESMDILDKRDAGQDITPPEKPFGEPVWTWASP